MNKDQSGGHSSYTLENLSKLDIPISRGTLVDKMDATSNSSQARILHRNQSCASRAVRVP